MLCCNFKTYKMNTIRIKALELEFAELENNNLLFKKFKAFEKVKTNLIKHKKIQKNIKKEQVALWNFTIRNNVTKENIEVFLDIYKYFDQLNYKFRFYEKIIGQISQIHDELDRCYRLNCKDFDIDQYKNELEFLEQIIKQKNLLK